ncbi:AAA family ATPase, partial [Clostridium sp. Sa3CVN1]|nr:AAA family ATPase [Clostridium cibarium]
FVLHKAIISRCNIFNFKALTKDDIKVGIVKSIDRANDNELNIKYTDEAVSYIAEISQGDYRKAYNILELAINSQLSSTINITVEYVEGLEQSHMLSDSSGDEYYNLLSALQKSIRGSDPDAAVHYLARLIKGGNLTAIIRRISVIVAEDIGLAFPSALTVVNSGIELALKVGLPEAQIILSELVIYLATLPKSNSAYLAIKDAMNDLEN